MNLVLHRFAVDVPCSPSQLAQHNECGAVCKIEYIGQQRSRYDMNADLRHDPIDPTQQKE